MVYFLFALFLGAIAGVTSFKKERDNRWLTPLMVGITVFIVFGLLNFLGMPTLNFWGFDGVWSEITIATFVGAIFSCVSMDYYGEISIKGIFKKWQAIPFWICLLMLLVRVVSSSEMLRSNAYYKLLEPCEVADSTFVNNVHPIPVEKMISVNQVYAEDLASKRIESMPSLGSRCVFGKADMINLNGSFDVKTADEKELKLTFDNEKVWVIPLEHNGFWKWLKNDVTEGYAIVSAHDPSRVFLVTEVNGQPLRLRYLRSAFFGDEIERYVRTSGYASYGLTEYSMELDDSGKPYWVITIYEPTIGFSGEDAVGVLVVDMQTGKMEEYSIDDAPSWIDRIQPDDFLFDQINYWGAYHDGWSNAVFAKTGVRRATPGMSLVYSEGKSYWYSGIQSVGADNSSSGFMLIDTRTKECKLYSVAGINEEAAIEVIEAQSDWVRQSDFLANPPVLYNVHGIPTYYMTLTGDGIKNAGYAFVSLKNENHFAVETTPRKALQEYLKVIQMGNQFAITDGDKIADEVLLMTVRDIVCENGTYYVLFNEVKGKEFIGTTDAFPELKWTKKGQKVNVSYTVTEAEIISLNSYDVVDFEI